MDSNNSVFTFFKEESLSFQVIFKGGLTVFVSDLFLYSNVRVITTES